MVDSRYNSLEFDNNSKISYNNKEFDNVIRNLLKLQCIFLFEKEIEELKNSHLLKDIKSYIKKAKIINLHTILLTVVKCFTEKYFMDVQKQLSNNFDFIPLSFENDYLATGTNIINKCLNILEKRMFQSLYEYLSQEPIYFLMIFNKFDLDFATNVDRYKLELSENDIKCKLEQGFHKRSIIKMKSINIFELIKYVYYNAVISAKKEISNRIFKQFLHDKTLTDIKLGKHKKDPCIKFMQRQFNGPTDTKSEPSEEENLKLVEYLIKKMWDYLPNLKDQIHLSKDTFPNQLNNLYEFDESYKEDENQEVDQNDDKIEDWTNIITGDGETMYLNAPTYKSITEFLPFISREPTGKIILSDSDFELKPRRTDKSCAKQDLFDAKLESIFQKGKILVGDKLVPFKVNKRDRLMSYIKTRNHLKKSDAVHKELWSKFQQKYFTFDEQDSHDTGKRWTFPIRMHEFYDQMPRYLTGKVKPIDLEIRNNTRYLCAECGLFITKGTGLDALGYKWHSEHFMCRVCNVEFTQLQYFVLYRGVILCAYDAENILGGIVTDKKCFHFE